jgi:hypothetical protein
MPEPALLCERDMVRPDGTFNRAAMLRIAAARTGAERDLDVLVAAYGTAMRMPVDVSQHNARAWRRQRAAAVDCTGLRLTPYRVLLAHELLQLWRTAHALRSAQVRDRAAPARVNVPPREPTGARFRKNSRWQG